MCLDQNQGKDFHSGVAAIAQGSGLTENGTFGVLLNTNVTVIKIEECRQILRDNSTNKQIRNKLKNGIPYGLNDQFLCAQGTQNEEVSKS